MPTTTPDGLPYETLTDGEPTRTLHGGSSGTADILARKAQTALTSLRSEIATLQSEVDTLTGRGWHDITAAGGQLIDSNTTILVPAENTYDMIRIRARGSLDGVGFLSMRINADTTTDLHRRQRILFDPATGAIDNNTSSSGSTWLWASWGTSFNNTAEATIFNTNVSSALSYQGWSVNQDGTAADRRLQLAGGDLSFNRTLSSIQFVGTNTTINSVRIWIEGHRV